MRSMLAFLIVGASLSAAAASGGSGEPVEAVEATECKSTGSGYNTCGPRTGLGCEAALRSGDGALPLEVRFSSNSSGPAVLTVSKTAADFEAHRINYTFGPTVYAEVISPCFQKDGFQHGSKAYGAVKCSISAGGAGTSLSIQGDFYDYGIITDQPRKVLNVHACSFEKTDVVLAANTTRVDIKFSQGRVLRAQAGMLAVLATAAVYLIL